MNYLNTNAHLEAEVARLRAELDAVSAAIPSVEFMDPPDGGDTSLAEQVRRMAALIEDQSNELGALRAQSAPEGWQMVPVEPTIEMMDGAFDDIRLSDAHTTYGVTEHVWAYMLAAAPKPEVR
jgi:hypothetical protein